MGMRGPPPTPSNIVALRGNPGKRPVNRAEPKPPIKIPRPPAWLDDRARAEWRWITPRLARYRIVTELDRTLIASYCSAYSRFVQAEETLRTQPLIVSLRRRPGDNEDQTVYVTENPWLAVSNKARKQMHQTLAHLGMTPAARSQIIARPRLPDGSDADGADPFGIL